MIRNSLLVAVCVALSLSPALAEETVDEIIAKNIEAKGGKAVMDAAKTMRMTGTMAMGGGMEAPFTVETKRPMKMRLEFVFQGMTGIQAYDGEQGWTVMPFMGKMEPELMTGDDLKNAEEQADFDGPLVDYEKKGNTVESLGLEEVEGTEAIKLKVTLKNGDIPLHLSGQRGLHRDQGRGQTHDPRDRAGVRDDVRRLQGGRGPDVAPRHCERREGQPAGSRRSRSTRSK